MLIVKNSFEESNDYPTITRKAGMEVEETEEEAEKKIVIARKMIKSHYSNNNIPYNYFLFRFSFLSLLLVLFAII